MALVVGLTALLTFSLTCLTGWLLACRARLRLAHVLAAGFASTFAVITATALLSELTGHLPPWSTALVAFAASAVIWLKGRDQPIAFPHCPPVLLVVPAVMALHAYVSYRIGFGIGQHPAVFRAWYNADWFKHLGHAHALVNLGLPAKDIFGGGDRLHYYWLFYLLPAIGGSIHGETIAALAAINIVLVFFFWLFVTCFLKELGLSDRQASVLTLVGWTVFTMDGTLQIAMKPPDLWEHVTNNEMASGLLTALNTFIPQHLLMVSGVLAFGLLWTLKRTDVWWPRLLALAPVIVAGATSTLLGVSVVIAAGLFILLDERVSLHRRLGIVAIVGLLALGFVFAFQVVDLSLGQDALSSPAFETQIDQRSYGLRIFYAVLRQIALLGLALPLGWWGLMRGYRRDTQDHRPLLAFLMLIVAVGMVVIVGSDVAMDGKRLVQELSLRNGYLVSLGCLAGLAILIRDLPHLGRDRGSTLGLITLMIALALPSNILNFIWQGWSGPQWQVIVPDADMHLLTYLSHESPVNALVLQYPERPFIVDGSRDTWVPIFAGRMVLGSYRSTAWSEGRKQVELAQRFYAGDLVKVPVDVDYVYLSRALHPTTYDMLMRRMSDNAVWMRDYCLADACLFKRASRTGSR